MGSSSAQQQSFHQALLKLERGSDTPSVQLFEAAGIVGIDLDAEIIQKLTTSWSAPKEEWVLRWLMKKTKSSNAEGQAYRLHPTSWNLYRNLLYRIPPRSLVTILHEYKVLDILKATFDDLNAICKQGETASNTATSTSDVQPSSGKRGKKRKRPSEVDGIKDAQQTNENDGAGMNTQSQGRTVLSILQFVTSLVSLPSNVSHDHTSEMKSKVQLVVRGDVQTAAKVLGSAYRHATGAISGWIETGNDESISQLLKAMPSIQTIWDCRVDRSVSDNNSLSTTEGFTVYVLPEGLELLSQLRQLPPSTQAKQYSTIVEATIALSFVLPLRDTFFTKTGTSAISNESAPSPSTFLFTELRSRMKNRDTDLSNNLLPILLDVVARTVPRDTFRKESQEAPWLEMVFITLTSRCGCSPFSDPVWDDASTSVNVLNNLLEVAINRRIKLSLPILCQYAQRYSGLNGGDKNGTVNWSLIANLLRLSVDIVLPNSGLAISQDLLTSLVSRITGLWVHGTVVDPETSDVVKNGIVIPLLRGFSDARDLFTFVQLWTEQLEQIQSTRNGKNASFALSVWEDDDVATVYSTVLNVELSSQNLQHVDELFSGLGNSAVRYSSAVLLDAIFPIVSADIDAADAERYLSILYTVLETRPSYQWRLWRLARHFLENPSLAVALQLNKIVAAAAHDVESTLSKKLTTKSLSEDQYLASLHSLRFLILVVSQESGNSHTNVLNPFVSRLADLIRELVTPKSKKGLSDGLGIVTSFIVDSLIALLANPASIAKISSESRVALFRAIFPISSTSAPEKNERFGQIWNILVSSDWVEAVSSVVHDVVIVVLDHLQSDNSVTRQLVDMLSSIPPVLIPSHQRVKLLDELQRRLLTDQNMDGQLGMAILSLMTRLIESPKSSSSKLVSDSTGVWEIAKKLPASETRLPLHTSFRQFIMAVIGRVALLSESSRRAALQKLADLTLQLSASKSPPQLSSLHFFVYILTIQTLTSSPYEGYIEDKGVSGRLRDLRGEVNSLLSDKLAAFRRQTKSSSSSGVDLDAFMGVLACLQALDKSEVDDKVCKTLKKIDNSGIIASIDPSVDSVMKRGRIHLEEGDIKDIDGFLDSCLSLFPADKLQSDEVRRTLCEIQRRISTIDQPQICELLGRVFQAPSGSHDVSNKFIISGLLLTSLRPAEERDGIVFRTVSSLFSDLCRLIPQSETTEAFCSNMELLDLLLHSQTRCLTQWNIDYLLASLSIALSASGMSKLRDVSSPGALYLRICRVLTMLFGQYRQKLSGRMHIVVSLMQRLLRCLFLYETRAGAPGVSQAKLVKMTSALPSWVTAQEECEISRQPECAIQYTRLLTLLCDPTVSAVQRHTSSRALSGHGSSGQQLTDNTKKVKSLAGQHLQYVILEYAICSLRGRLLPAVKAALVPGLYAILNVMTQEVMRGMNASMDGSSRAMFRSLYEDYVRFGRWDQG
ncbi:hypothetical protein KEM56_005144 [Ascosphaera pollenicola]|nr:hypothetical protein KEM56_005144 [Ascosphaera pollenicola]